jgi:hypothetical protein
VIGPRIGPAVGPRIGVAIGVSTDEVGAGAVALPGVTQDSASLKYAPATAGEWATVLSAAGLAGGNPADHYNCQDASGNLTDAIGAVPLVVGGSPLYQQAVTGWTRKAVAITATTVQAFSVALGVGPDASATSVAWLVYVVTSTTPGGNRNVVYATGSVTAVGIDHIVSGNKLMIRCGVNTTNSAAAYTLATVYPVLLVYNRTASSVTMYTDQEALVGTFSVVVDGVKGYGATQGNGDSSSKYLMGSVWSGAAAEQFTTAGARALLQTLGWTIPW